MFSRALRRSKLPLSFSKGFNPHLIMSFANAMSVGMTTDGDYVDVGLDYDDVNFVNTKFIHKKLQEVMPKGITILKVEALKPDSKSLTKLINYADYEITCYNMHFGSLDILNMHLNDFNSLEQIEITRKNKKGKEVIQDIRPNFTNVSAYKNGKNVIFSLRILPVENSLIKPETVILELLKRLNYYGSKVNMKTHRKELALIEEDSF